MYFAIAIKLSMVCQLKNNANLLLLIIKTCVDLLNVYKLLYLFMLKRITILFKNHTVYLMIIYGQHSMT